MAHSMVWVGSVCWMVRSMISLLICHSRMACCSLFSMIDFWRSTSCGSGCGGVGEGWRLSGLAVGAGGLRDGAAVDFCGAGGVVFLVLGWGGDGVLMAALAMGCGACAGVGESCGCACSAKGGRWVE